MSSYAYSLWEDLADSFHPVVTGDLGSFFSVLGIAKERQDVTDAFDTASNQTAQPGRPHRSEQLIAEEKRSLALMELLQKAIERRELALRQLGDEPGAPASRMFGAGTPVARLALDPNTDEALAKEDISTIKLTGSRVDMTDLLPPTAFETDGFPPHADDVDFEAGLDDEDDIEVVTHEAAPEGSTRKRAVPHKLDAYAFQSTSLALPPAFQDLAPREKSLAEAGFDSTTGSVRTAALSEMPAATGITAAAPADDKLSEGSTGSYADHLYDIPGSAVTPDLDPLADAPFTELDEARSEARSETPSRSSKGSKGSRAKGAGVGFRLPDEQRV